MEQIQANLRTFPSLMASLPPLHGGSTTGGGGSPATGRTGNGLLGGRKKPMLPKVLVKQGPWWW